VNRLRVFREQILEAALPGSRLALGEVLCSEPIEYEVGQWNFFKIAVERIQSREVRNF
jgi:hypothetical protein